MICLAHLPRPKHVVVLFGARQCGVLLKQEVEPLRALPDACTVGAASVAQSPRSPWRGSCVGQGFAMQASWPGAGAEAAGSHAVSNHGTLLDGPWQTAPLNTGHSCSRGG